MGKITKNKENFKIKLAGVGNFGNGVIKDFGERNLPGVECLDMNTGWAFKTANKFVKLGVNFTKGLGAGAIAEVGKRAAEEDRIAIIDAIKDCDLLIIVAGLGGGTGSGATPVVAGIAKELNIPTVAFVTLPFEFEGEIRKKNAQYGLENLKNIVDVLFTIEDEKFLTDNAEPKNTRIVELYKEIERILEKNILKVINLCNSKASKNKSMRGILKDVESYKTSFAKC